jgi:hypothetical protein
MVLPSYFMNDENMCGVQNAFLAYLSLFLQICAVFGQGVCARSNAMFTDRLSCNYEHLWLMGVKDSATATQTASQQQQSNFGSWPIDHGH